VALQKWSRSFLSDARQKLLMAQEIILRLDEAQDIRQLSSAEFNLRSKLKKRITGWLAVEKARKKQCARINNIREGDANTRFFHLRANGRRRKNFVQHLRHDGGWFFNHEDKQRLIQDHFTNVMNAPPPRSRDLSWPDLDLPTLDLASLDSPFSDEEIWRAICLLPQDKAPGPDGFTGHFFKKCWPTIRADVMAAINSFYNNRNRDLNLLNKANIVLIPKKDGIEEISDFRPISLIHAVAKIITKTLALRLAPFMNSIISPCQSAFIKRRSIHDNFLYVRNLTRRFHKSKTLSLLIKLDISKAFDSVRWDYLLSVLEWRGFPARWREWIASLLTSSMSRVILNGSPLDSIHHGRGLRQGDPLSPLLFILAIDPLHRILQVATERGLLSKLKGRAASFRVSMYADDAVIFLKPTIRDVDNLKRILANFGEVTGLQTNLRKTSVTPISCDSVDLDAVLANLPLTRASFPI
jgi:hypothetical protein